MPANIPATTSALAESVRLAVVLIMVILFIGLGSTA
jgi:hypothetical protein